MARALNQSGIFYEPKINSRTVQGKRNGDGAWFAIGVQEGEGNKDIEGATGQEMLTNESRAYLFVHGFCKWGTSAPFDMQTVDLYAGSYLRQTSAKALSATEKEKKEKYLQPCLYCSRSFTPMV